MNDMNNWVHWISSLHRENLEVSPKGDSIKHLYHGSLEATGLLTWELVGRPSFPHASVQITNTKT